MHAPVLQLDPAEVTSVKNTIQEHRTAFSLMNSKKAESMSANEQKTINKEKSINELRRFAKMVKSSKQYTSAIGDDLRIIGSVSMMTLQEELKPVLRVSFNGQYVILKYKKNKCDGIRIYSRMGSEAEFKFITVETGTSYTDQRQKSIADKPEQREYYAIYVINYIESGQASDVVKVVVP